MGIWLREEEKRTSRSRCSRGWFAEYTDWIFSTIWRNYEKKCYLNSSCPFFGGGVYIHRCLLAQYTVKPFPTCVHENKTHLRPPCFRPCQRDDTPSILRSSLWARSTLRVNAWRGVMSASSVCPACHTSFLPSQLRILRREEEAPWDI